MAIQQILRASGQVVECLLRVDSEELVQGGMHFTKMHRAFGDFSTESISRPDDMSRFEATTGD